MAMASMAAATAWSTTDRLSQLSDDILTHILSFAPSREAARTTALSRRWRRPLWLETGAVNVDYRSYAAGGDRRRAIDDADHAYAFLCSRGRVPKKLSVVMPDDAILCVGGSTYDEDETVEDAQGVEDPRLEWLKNGGLPRCTLPFAAVRVLELTGYDLQPYSDQRRQLAFPHLEAMRLRRCRTELATLQKILAAAPKLADVRLDSLTFVDHHDVYWLRCEAATVVVLENCRVLLDDLHLYGCNVRLEAPRLLHFRYVHVTAFHDENSFTFRWEKPRLLEHVHLEVHSAASAAVNLWRSILSDVSHVRFLKLTSYSMADLDIEIVPYFHNLERLEIEELCGWSVVNHGAAAKAVVNLLHKCSSLVELRVKFSWRKYLRKINADPADEMAAFADFTRCRSVDNVDDEEEADCCKSLEDLHGQFCCESTTGVLRKVVVEFDGMELTCFQVRLVRFLAKSVTTYLEEFIVDGGKGYDSSRIDHKVARWRKRHKPPPPPIWPPPLSEFPPLEMPPLTQSNEEFDDEDVFEMKEDTYHRNYYYYYSMDEVEEDEDISPRHYLHSSRKKKKGGSPECFSVTSRAKGMMSGWNRPGPIGHHHRHCCWDWEEEEEEEEEEGDASEGSPLETMSLQPSGSMQGTPCEPWSAPLMHEFPLLRPSAHPGSTKASSAPCPSFWSLARRVPRPIGEL